MDHRADAGSSFFCVNCGAKSSASDGSCPACGAPPGLERTRRDEWSFLDAPAFWVLDLMIHALRRGRDWIAQQRRIRRGVVIAARFTRGWMELEVSVTNRRPEALTVVGIGLQRRQDPGATYRLDMTPAARIPHDGTFTATIDVNAAVTSAPVNELFFNRDLNEVFAELHPEERRIVWPLPPHVREELRVRRQRYRHFGHP